MQVRVAARGRAAVAQELPLGDRVSARDDPTGVRSHVEVHRMVAPAARATARRPRPEVADDDDGVGVAAVVSRGPHLAVRDGEERRADRARDVQAAVEVVAVAVGHEGSRPKGRADWHVGKVFPDAAARAALRRVPPGRHVAEVLRGSAAERPRRRRGIVEAPKRPGLRFQREAQACAEPKEGPPSVAAACLLPRCAHGAVPVAEGPRAMPRARGGARRPVLRTGGWVHEEPAVLPREMHACMHAPCPGGGPCSTSSTRSVLPPIHVARYV